jgi:uncharacterized membrane protein YkoI
MRYILVVGMFMLSLAGTAFAASEKELALSATVPMDEAIKTAVASVPGGKVYEAEISKKKGQAAYKIEIVDSSKKTHKVYVDAQNGKIIVDQ